jgi:CDP-glucose 4,6-dehydratase
VEDMVMFGGAFAGKRVWLSGATGFKGAWLAEWLLALGAKVESYALAPDTDPSLFEQLRLADHIDSKLADIRDAAAVEEAILHCEPDFVFHLAAQPLVRRSYAEPLETYGTNVMGTAHVLNALRKLQKPCAAVIVTTDKCYENREWVHGYREEDPLGGYDPYSSSKAAAELVTSAYRRSYFQQVPVRIASARAGNVIGGGDWATDRIVPDCMRALHGGKPIAVRNPGATRPWQHVLEPLSGYLWLAASVASAHSVERAGSLCSAFNFGPNVSSNRSVRTVVEELLKHVPGSWEDKSDAAAPHEAGKLHLSTDKAYHLLGWEPVWDFTQTIEQTAKWYNENRADSATGAAEATQRQITEYVQRASEIGIPWATS